MRMRLHIAKEVSEIENTAPNSSNTTIRIIDEGLIVEDKYMQLGPSGILNQLLLL